MFKKRFLMILVKTILLTSTVLRVNAQASPPAIKQPSPEAVQLFRFQDYPMDYSTGLPKISIPIYQVTSGSLSVPISLSYHASGSKVYDDDGPLALGWSLNAGGMISRTIYGAADFGTPSMGTFPFPYPFKYAQDLADNNLANLQYFEKIMHFDKTEGEVGAGTFLDSEYDIFSYSFNNMGGKFIFKDENSVKTPVLLPYKAYKIIPIFTSSGLSKIELTDDKGIFYEFVASETYSASSFNATSSWALSKITSADKTDVITFKYSGFNQERRTISRQGILQDRFQSLIVGEPYPSSEAEYSEATSTESYNISRLTEIEFNQGKILFNLVDGSDKMANIQIKALDGHITKTIQFERSSCYTRSLGTATNKLDAIVFKDDIGNSTEKYSFEYNPVVATGQYLDVHFCDWWGYFNNSGVSDNVPHYDVPYDGYDGITELKSVGNPEANLEPNLTALKNGVLKKITYPTGGTSEFIYENNKCTLNGLPGMPKLGPGLRVYQIKSVGIEGTEQIKTYKYGKDESGYGAIELLPEMATTTREEIYNFLGVSPVGPGPYHPEQSANYSQRTFYSGFIPEYSDLAQRPVIYTEVAEYIGTVTDNIGKSVYKYDEEGYAKWVLQPMAVHEQLFLNPMHIYDYNYWNNPSLILRSDYRRTENSGVEKYKLKKETESYYSGIITEFIKGLHVRHMHVLPQTGSNISTHEYAEQYATLNGIMQRIPALHIYTYADYRLTVGYKNLVGTGEIIYNEDGSTSTNGISYTYNSKNLINKTTRITSATGAKVTDIKYPFDYTGIPVLAQMASLNMLDYTIEQFESKNSTTISKAKTNYYDWGNDLGAATPMIAPRTVEISKGSNDYETRLHYYGYDANGNPISVAKENDALNSYIWDYNKSYPVAEVKNATAVDIAYTSFEADGIGNWAGQNATNIVSNVVSITGSKYYNFNGTTLTKSLLTAAKRYVVSYWTKNGMYNVSGTALPGWPKSLRSVTINGNTWTNWEHKVTGVTSVTINGTGVIDELRLYPETALMTTYTFIPLDGMTSQSDVNNRITYYEYDNYGKLKFVRDMNNNIIKTFSYKYQSSTP